MIFIDGDACNVVKITEKIAQENSIPCHIYCDVCHELKSTYSEVHIVEKGKNSADFAIINKCGPNDIVITNDSGLAAMVLAKNGIAINTKGFEYTKRNIMSYLTSRHIRSDASRKSSSYHVKGFTHDGHRRRNDYAEILEKAICKTMQN